MNEMEEKIIRKSLQYFAANNYDNASLNSIAKAIGITKGGIYHYFESKEDLLLRCIIYFFDTMTELLDNMIHEDDNISSEDVISSFFSLDELFKLITEKLNIDFLNDYSTYLYLLFTAIKKFPDLKKRVSKIYFGTKEGLTQKLEHLKRKGEINRDVNCEAFAMQLLITSEGFMLLAAMDVDNTLKVRDSGKVIAENLVRSLKEFI